MKQPYLVYWLIVALAGVLLTGCEQRVNYTVENSGTQTLNNLTLRSDSGFVFEHGILAGGTHSSFSGTMKLKKENELKISWNIGEGQTEEKTVVVPSTALRDKRMRVFTITPNMEIEQRWRWDE